MEMRLKITNILKGKHWSGTTDSWTSCSNTTYTTCTAHFIDLTTWTLHHFPLGIFQKQGRSRAEEVVHHIESIWGQFELSYTNLVCVVTDTEPTMVKAGCILHSNSPEQEG